MSSKETVIKATVQVGMDISDVQSNAKAIQNTLKNFKMPAGLEEQFEKTFKGLEAEITKVQTLMQSGFKTKSDVTGFEKSKKNINNLYNTLQNLYSSFKDESLMMNVDFNTDEIKQAKKELQDLKQQLSGKVETDSFRKLKEQIEQITSLSKSGAAKSLQESFAHLNLDSAREDLNGIVAGLANFARGEKEAKTAAKSFQDAWNSGNLKDIEEKLKDMPENMKKVAVAAIEAKKGFDQMGNTNIGKINTEINELNERIGRLENIQVNKMEQSFSDVGDALSGAKNHAEQFGNVISNSAQDMYSFNGQMEQIKHRVQDFFSLTNSVMLFRRAIQSAFDSVKELDAAMTETAVVTDFSVGDMWDKLPEYTNMAKELGATTLGTYETMTLFYQQGLDNNQVMEVGTETMKMARIAGLDYADATDLMTAALRGFNMEVDAVNATRINDVVSKLAAVTAADTNEILTAMSKTASIASSANMEFETTAAFLSQIVETTREPAETAGTALKTIIARFTEMKKATSDIINVDGEEISVNKVEAALKSAGVQLRDTSGEFRDLDDVFLELAQNWDHLDLMTQRYIATTAAGSRQQSRFIAMMSNYDRTMELVDAAYDSSGASAAQFAKTQDSLEAKLNKLKDAWQEFTLGLANNEVIKAVVDALTKLLDIINKTTDGADDFSTLISRVFMIMGGLKLGRNIFDKMFSGVTARFLSEGKKGAEAFNKGLEQGIKNYNSDGYFKQFGAQLSGIKNKIVSTRSFNKRNKQLLYGSTDGMEMDTWYNSMSNLMNPNDFAKQMPNIATTMENSLREALNYHNLSDEGKEWATGLIKNFIHRIKNNGDVKQALQQMKKEAQIVLDSENSSEIIKEDAEKVVQIDDKDIKVKKEHNPQQQKKTGMDKANAVTGSVMAIGMAGNLIASSMEEAGTASKEVTDTIASLSSGLSTAGSMAMMLGTAFGPVGIAIGVAVGLLSTFVNLAKQAKERTKEMHDNNIDIAKEYNEETKAVNEQVKAYEDLYKIYKENGEETEELKTSKEELIESLELEKYGVNALTSSYDEVAEAARKARIEMLETNSIKQSTGLQGAVANALVEGEAAAFEGTGWTGGGTGFKINLGADDNYQTLASLIEEIAAEEGVTGLTMNENEYGNMQISGLENSPEAQRIWMKIISQVMSKYQTEVDGDSTAYGALVEYWSKVGSYYEAAEEIHSAEIETQKEMVREDATEKIQNRKIVSYQDFNKAINDILNELDSEENKEKYKDLSEEDKIAIAKDAVVEQTEKGIDYNAVYTQLLKLKVEDREYTQFVEEITSKDIEFIVKGEVQIEEGETLKSFQKRLTAAEVDDAMFGASEKQDFLLSYGKKLVSGEEITQEEIDNVYNFVNDNFGYEAAREFQLLSDEDIASQLEFIQSGINLFSEQAELSRQAFVDSFDDAVLADYGKYGEYEANIGLQLDRATAEMGVQDDVNSDETRQLVSNYLGENVAGELFDKYDAAIEDININSYSTEAMAVVQAFERTMADVKQKLEEEDAPLLTGQAEVLWDERIYANLKTKYAQYYLDEYGVDPTLFPTYNEMYEHNQGLTAEANTALQNIINSIANKHPDLDQDITDYENSFAYKLIQAGVSSEEIIGKDFNQDKVSGDYYDLAMFSNKMTDVLGTMMEFTNGRSLGTSPPMEINGTTNEARILTRDEYLKFNGQNVDEEVLQFYDKLEELEAQGITIKPKLDETGVITGWEGIIENIDGTEITLDIQNVDQVQELYDFFSEFDGKTITTQMMIEHVEAEEAEKGLEGAFLQAENFQNAMKLIDEDYRVTAEDAEQLLKYNPELLEGAYATADGYIQLNKAVVDGEKGEVINNLQESNQAVQDNLEDEIALREYEMGLYEKLSKVATTEQGKIITEYQNLDGEQQKYIQTLIKETLTKEREAASQAQTTEDSTNLGINSSKATASAATTALDEINAEMKKITENSEIMWRAFRGQEANLDEWQDILKSTGDAEGYAAFDDTTTWITEQHVIDYMQAQAISQAEGENGRTTEEVFREDFGYSEDEIDEAGLSKIASTTNVVELAFDEKQRELDNIEIDAEINQAKVNNYANGGLEPQKETSGGSGGSSKADKEKDYINPSLENIEEKLENLEKRRENGDIDAAQYQLEKKGLLTLKQGYLQKEFETALANSTWKDYFKIGKNGEFLYNEEKFNALNDEKQSEVKKEYQRLKEINDSLLEVNTEIGKMIPTIKSIAKADAVIEATERSYENREMNAVEYQETNDAALSAKYAILQHNLEYELENNTEKAFFHYDDVLDTILLDEEKVNELAEDLQKEVEQEYESVKKINDEMNEIEDKMKDLEFKNPEDEQQYYRGYAGETNARTDLEHLDRQRNENDKYKELIGKLPEEVQGPLNLGLLGMDLVYEAQEVGINQGLKADLEEQMRAKYNDSEFAGTGEGKYYDWDPTTQSWKLDEETISDPKLREDTRKKILDEFNEMQDFAKKWKEVSDELSGGIITKGMRSAGKALKAFAEEVKDSDFDDGFLKVETGFKVLDEALNNLAEKLESNQLIKDFLDKKAIDGLGWGDKEREAILSNEKLTNFLTKTGLGELVSEVGWGEGATNGELISFGSNFMGSILESAGGFLNFDMLGTGLELFNGAKGMFEQVSSKIEELVGYITQATQVIIDAWTNREDYLYNFLKIIEKHIQEYENLQREDNQFQKGRTASVEDIKRNWNEQWKSLQTQLEEQQERLETRQQELNRSRWNPFQLISGWDPTSDTLYENREVKFLWDTIIGFGEAFAPFGTGAFFSQMNQLYEDYDTRVQNSYEDRLAAEQALLDIEDQRLELVKAGAEEATKFEQKVLDALIQKEQEQIDELTRLNESITEANSKLISTLQNNLEKIRQDRENEKKEEELGEKERRLAYLRQDTSGANMMEIKKLEEELEEGHEDYTDTLIDQKISELQEQNDKAAEQRQQQIELLQAQLEWNEKYGLYWDTIYGMLYTFDENGNAILKPENFDVDGNIRENSELAKMLGTFSDRMGMSIWSAVLDSEELKLLGRYYGAFVGVNGVDGNLKNRWALDNPGADDPNYAYPEQEIPEGVWGVLYSMEIMFKKYFVNSDHGLANGIGRVDEFFKNAFGKLFGNEEWANYNFEGYKPEQAQSTFFAGLKKAGDDAAEWFAKAFSKNSNNAKSFALNAGGNQNYGDTNINNTFTIGTVGESVSLDDMVDKVSNAIKGMFTSPINSLQKSR